MTQKPSINQSDWSDWSDDPCHFVFFFKIGYLCFVEFDGCVCLSRCFRMEAESLVLEIWEFGGMGIPIGKLDSWTGNFAGWNGETTKNWWLNGMFLEKLGERTIFGHFARFEFWEGFGFQRKLVQWVEFQKGAHTLRLKCILARDSSSFFFHPSNQKNHVRTVFGISNFPSNFLVHSGLVYRLSGP